MRMMEFFYEKVIYISYFFVNQQFGINVLILMRLVFVFFRNIFSS